MLVSVMGTYENGTIRLDELPKGVNHAKVIVTLIQSGNINGPERLGDFTLRSPDFAGLPLPTRFRLKLATIDVSIVVKKLGTMEENDRKGISTRIREAIA